MQRLQLHLQKTVATHFVVTVQSHQHLANLEVIELNRYVTFMSLT